MSWFARKKGLSPEVARVFEKIHQFRRDERIQNQSLPEELKSQIDWSSSVDVIPGAWGEFGKNVNNPIPTNGPLGEILYLSSIKMNDGRRIAFHRLGSVNKVDVFEIVSFDGRSWSLIYLNMYYPRKSTKVPDGFRFFAKDQGYSWIRGTNYYMGAFPYGILQRAIECSERIYRLPFVDPDLKGFDEGVWTRPPQHLTLLDQLQFGGRVEAKQMQEVDALSASEAIGVSGMRTTIAPSGISTSLEKNGFAYVVSTIHRAVLGSFYQTAIMKMSPDVWRSFITRGVDQEIVYRIEAKFQLQAVQEHIDAVYMAASKPEDTWLGTKKYQDDLMDDMGSGTPYPTLPLEMDWTDEKIVSMISGADIHYVRAQDL